MEKPIKQILLFLMIFSALSCSKKEGQAGNSVEIISLEYAKGFQILRGNGYWEIEINQPWTGATQSFRYLILEENSEKPEGDFDAIVQLPVDKIILTSTTHIPHLDLLIETNKLIGFPNTDLISSPTTRSLIEQKKVIDLGSGPSTNPELIIDMAPDWIMISTLGDDIRYLDLLKTAGVPALINGEYVEQHPLGRAEWIKFTGILLGKYEDAKKVFEEVETSYLKAEKLIERKEKALFPTVLSGILYQDIWYAPGSESWGAKILENAGGNYIFEDQKGTGSVQLNYEYVLDKALNTDFWIGSADFPSIQKMGESEPKYKAFEAWKEGRVYSYTQKKGAKGGLEYFELGYMRPDLILKDLIKILHPELLPDYELYFYQQLHEK
ncbi:ABC transporter substrate-binding protein [Algoriphagus sp.]|uniref:ABC transporter substrate-binding protein n=1 Tax=Algoriphagus sp. TaxID=1872435 RepID=UPI0025D04539|nr:ABC transporter substrate-binding protein [Algoriphagus sp.]